MSGGLVRSRNLEHRDRWARGGLLWTWHVNHVVGARISASAWAARVGPNGLSVTGMCVGAITSALIVVVHRAGGATWLCGVIGVLGWQAAYSFDCADGQLARFSKRASSAGAVLDVICDFMTQTSAVAAAVYLAGESMSGQLGVLTAAAWLAPLLYATAASTRGLSMRDVAGAGRGMRVVVAGAARQLQDYGLQVFALGFSIGLGQQAVTVVLLGIGVFNAVVLAGRVARILAFPAQSDVEP